VKKLLVTGGAGFIGANFIRCFLDHSDDVVVHNLDKLTYAGDTDRLKELESNKRYDFIKGDICDKDAVKRVFSSGVDAVVHFAAESHVDRSIEDADPFESTNVRGTLNLLEAARRSGTERFVHISTDEVYGELGETGQFTETTPLNPNSPYSASKASADLFALAYRHTYGLPVVIVRPSNNYGPWQYPEKLIPVAVNMALDDRPVPVYAQGLNVREWLHVEDCALGIMAVLEKGREGEVYNIGSGEERRNIEVVKKILASLGKPESLIEFVKDRPGHDFRYSLDVTKIKTELGWEPGTSFEDGIERTVKWYVDNQAWWRKFL
jgi:dTDP-glucose 4,6-dehydratase